MDLKIYIQKRQYFNIQGSPIYFTGANPQSLQSQQGYIPGNAWIDVTKDVGNLEDIALTFTEQRDSAGVDTPGVTFVRRTSSSNLGIEADAYRYIKDWLINDVAAPLNAISVKIEHVSCGTYENWQITRGQVSFCDGNAICQFDVTLQQQDELYHCIQKEVIADNWQGWFQVVPANGKKHPRFSYCNEIKPNGQLLLQWYVMTAFLATNTITFFIILTAINPILWILNRIEDALNSIPGVDVDWNIPEPISLGDIFSAVSQAYIESAGCGREHPAPLIRDYITNVCDKCGVKVDHITAPAFFASNISLEASSGTRNSVPNPYFNACFLFAPIKRGIRRFKNLNLVFGYQGPNTTDFYIPDNAPLIALSDFLTELARPFNSDWRIKKVNGIPYLYFWRQDWFIDTTPVYDFSKGTDDYYKIVEGMCFEAYEIKYPATVDGLYSSDAVDTCGNEALRRMNGYAYAFGETDNNPLFEGILDSKTQFFGATKFRLDGASTDYIYDTAQMVLNGSIFTIMTGIPGAAGAVFSIFDKVMQDVRIYADYGLLLRDETCSLGKILIWDGTDYLNAKCVKTKKAYPTTFSNLPSPTKNIKYENQEWHERFPVESFVRGQDLTFVASTTGVYEVKDYYGYQFSKQTALLVNWPMYFNPGYQDTLWDWWWWIQDPRLNPKMGLTWYVRIELCCEDLVRCGVFNDASESILGQRVKVNIPYYPDGKVSELSVNYGSSTEVGKYIEIKGTV